MLSRENPVLIGTAVVALVALVALRTFTDAGVVARFAVVVATVVAADAVLGRAVR
ncbi:hypothetical protein [Halorubrum sp. HHNYT27]|uniref:hypothetical protein n=1 Tax=Halorubrum sp. HHNYT27 TaxID=3402275 RepID=UPI003EB99BCA